MRPQPRANTTLRPVAVRDGRIRGRVLHAAVALLAGVALAGCSGSIASTPSGVGSDSLKETVEELVQTAKLSSIGPDGRLVPPSADVWNEVISLMSTTRTGITHVEMIDDDVFAVVLDSGVFSPFLGKHITAVQFSSGRESVCHHLGAAEAVRAGPCTR